MSGPLVVVGDALLDVDLLGTRRPARARTRRCRCSTTSSSDDAPGRSRAGRGPRQRDGARSCSSRRSATTSRRRGCASLLEGVDVIAACPHDGATPVKRRVRADGQSLVRLDSGGAPGGVGAAPRRVPEAVRGAGDGARRRLRPGRRWTRTAYGRSLGAVAATCPGVGPAPSWLGARARGAARDSRTNRRQRCWPPAAASRPESPRHASSVSAGEPRPWPGVAGARRGRDDGVARCAAHLRRGGAGARACAGRAVRGPLRRR